MERKRYREIARKIEDEERKKNGGRRDGEEMEKLERNRES